MINKVYGSLELIVNICVLGKIRIAALISKANLLSFFIVRVGCNKKGYVQNLPNFVISGATRYRNFNGL